MEFNGNSIKGFVLPKRDGFGIIEIIIAIAIISIALFGISRIILSSQRITIENRQKEQALNLAKEALEAVRSIRDESWDNISGLVMDAEYHPTVSGMPSSWQLATGNENIGEFARKVVFKSVSRDANDDIEPVFNAGNDDPDTKKVTATVLWKGDEAQVEITTYITNWRD